jgi:hypothetical protein
MIRKYRPDLAQGRTDAQILALRDDPELSREMTANYANQNSEFLKAHGTGCERWRGLHYRGFPAHARLDARARVSVCQQAHFRPYLSIW